MLKPEDILSKLNITSDTYKAKKEEKEIKNRKEKEQALEKAKKLTEKLIEENYKDAKINEETDTISITFKSLELAKMYTILVRAENSSLEEEYKDWLKEQGWNIDSSGMEFFVYAKINFS